MVTANALFVPVIKELAGVRIFNDITVTSTSSRTIMSRTYLPDLVSYASGGGGGGGGGTGSTTSTSSSSSSSSSSSGLPLACTNELKYITPVGNPSTWDLYNRDLENFRITSITMTITGNNTYFTGVNIGGSTVGSIADGSLVANQAVATFNGSWIVGKDAALRLLIATNKGLNNVKDMSVSIQCERP